MELAGHLHATYGLPQELSTGFKTCKAVSSNAEGIKRLHDADPQRRTTNVWPACMQSLPLIAQMGSCMPLCSLSANSSHKPLRRRAVLHNIKYDEEVATFANAAGLGADALSLLPLDKSKQAPRTGGKGGACTSISFSTGEPLVHASLRGLVLCPYQHPVYLR